VRFPVPAKSLWGMQPVKLKYQLVVMFKMMRLIKERLLLGAFWLPGEGENLCVSDDFSLQAEEPHLKKGLERRRGRFDIDVGYNQIRDIKLKLRLAEEKNLRKNGQGPWRKMIRPIG